MVADRRPRTSLPMDQQQPPTPTPASTVPDSLSVTTRSKKGKTKERNSTLEHLDAMTSARLPAAAQSPGRTEAISPPVARTLFPPTAPPHLAGAGTVDRALPPSTPTQGAATGVGAEGPTATPGGTPAPTAPPAAVGNNAGNQPGHASTVVTQIPPLAATDEGMGAATPCALTTPPSTGGNATSTNQPSHDAGGDGFGDSEMAPPPSGEYSPPSPMSSVDEEDPFATQDASQTHGTATQQGGQGTTTAQPLNTAQDPPQQVNVQQLGGGNAPPAQGNANPMQVPDIDNVDDFPNLPQLAQGVANPQPPPALPLPVGNALAAAAAARSQGSTAQGDNAPLGTTLVNGAEVPASKLTPKPVDGFPTIHGNSSRRIFDSITDASLQFLAQLPGATNFFVTAAWQHHGPVTAEFYKTVLSVLRSLTTQNDSLRIYESILHPNVNSSLGQPFLVTGLEEAEARALLDLRVLSTPTATLIVTTLDERPTGYLMTIGGLHLDNDERGADIVTRIIKNFFLTPTFLRDFNIILGAMPTENLTFARNVPDTEIAGLIIDSIRVSGLSVLDNMGNTSTEWRVYVRKFSVSQDDFDAVARMFNGVCIQDRDAQGSATRKRSDYQCNCCRGKDHPSGLCPLKTVPGFFNNDPSPLRNPTAPATPTTPAASNALGAYISQNTNTSRGHWTNGRGSYRGVQSNRGRGRGSGQRGGWN